MLKSRAQSDSSNERHNVNVLGRLQELDDACGATPLKTSDDKVYFSCLANGRCVARVKIVDLLLFKRGTDGLQKHWHSDRPHEGLLA